jgi:iron complex transport system permease protein
MVSTASRDSAVKSVALSAASSAIAPATTSSLAARDTRRFVAVLSSLVTALALLFAGAVMLGSVDLSLAGLWSGNLAPEAKLIVMELRLPGAVTAALAGMALAVSGQQMQVWFHNALAGPFVLGVDSGASLGVALMLIGLPLMLTLLPAVEIVRGVSTAFAAIAGASAVLALIIVLARYTLSDATLVIVGLMLNLLLGSVVSVLLYLADPMRLQAFVLWTFGSFGGVSGPQLLLFALLVAIGLLLAARDAKTLNALQLGPLQAASLGVDHRTARRRVLLATAVLAGATTAFCGPLGVLGTAAPHVARGLVGSADHRRLLPICALTGAAFALLADVLSRTLAAQGTLPLNAVLAVLCAPVVIAVLVRLNRSVP